MDFATKAQGHEGVREFNFATKAQRHKGVKELNFKYLCIICGVNLEKS
jgi:hypothetical protein